ncbi:hypothetical protein MKY88_20210 [Lysinibacillus sp. FSL R7-0073]|uniref:VOC family protein n=1 Tax=Lysinibacillus sp. FSL R7-0073 TaxID=2921669 RepID=UPI0030F7708F
MGRVIGFELNSQEPEKAAAFYSKVFGWEVAAPNWDYWPVKTGQKSKIGVNGGISKGPSDYVHEFKLKWMQLTKLSNRQQATGLLFCVRKWRLMAFILLIWWIRLV